MTVRPTRRALGSAALRWALVVVPGLLLIYAGWSSRVVRPALFGAPLVLLGVFAFTNTASSYLRLDAGVLTGRSLLGRISIQVDEIVRVVPIRLSYRSLLVPWNRPARMFDVCTSKGPTGLWLNPNLYGEAPIRSLLEQMRITPETEVENRVLDPFSRNRDYTSRYSH